MIPGTVRRATGDLNRRTEVVPVTWEDLGVRGRGPIIIFDILEAIDAAAVSAFEVTFLNQNVVFELGYAIGKERRIWLLRDPSHQGADRAWQEFHVLTGIRYTGYSNSGEIVDAFIAERPWEKEETVYSRLIEQIPPQATPTLLYLKSRHETDAEREVSRRVEAHRRSGVPVLTSDPSETAVQPLSWYVAQVYRAGAVLVHLTGTGRVDAELNNARSALVAGIAQGMGRPVLMLAEANYLAPLDYRDLLEVYSDPDEAIQRAEEWMAEHLVEVAEAARRGMAVKTKLRLATELSSLRLGEPVAEMEEDSLVDYFIETAAFRTVLNASTTVFVGRKGTGKTANLIRAAQVLEADRRNFVCVIQPAGYELNGLVRLLKRYSERDEKGYLVEALWKFLIVSEVALTLYRRIDSRPVPPQVDTPEWDFVSYLRDRPFLLEEFAVRLEHVVESILSRTSGESIADTRARISEELHAGALRDLRLHLGKLLHDAHRVVVLIDNLDKAWEKSADVDQLAYLLLGLLNTVGPIAHEFSRRDQWRETIRLSVAVFLRSDIFSEVQRVAPEPDRIPLTRLLWRDRELLLRVVEDRYRAARNQEVEGSELWDKFFVPIVRGTAVREYVISRVLPRPRDLLFYCNAAIASAVNRGHSIVEAADLEDAERTYSFFALEALKVEAGALGDKVEQILYEFAGSSAVMARSDALATIRRVVADAESERYFDLLRSFSFFGLETSPGHFAYPEEPAERVRDEALANRFSERYGRSPLIQIHPAFHRYLEVDDQAA